MVHDYCSQIHTCLDLTKKSMAAGDDVIKEALLFICVREVIFDRARKTQKKYQPFINYHYFIMEDVIVTVDTLTAQRKASLENKIKIRKVYSRNKKII